MTKLLSIIAIGACLSISSLYANDATVINLAGKQRMLTQKMSKEALFVTKGIDADKNKEALSKTEELFDKTLTGLINGDKDLDLPKNENKEIVTQLNKVSELWKSFKTSIDKVVAGKSDKATLEAIAKENLPLLKNMNQAVGMFAKASGSKLSPEVAKTLNRAGKQRMLTQKMTKELLLVANGINVDENKANAKKTGELFESTLKDLTDKCKNDEIKKQLGVVAKLWSEYKTIIEKADVSDASLKKAEELNIPLLKNMNKAVKMYEANAK